jgi:hypothetical protein
MIPFRFSGLISVLFLLHSHKGIAQQQQQNLQLVKEGVFALTDVMIRDITSPPVASRNYVYTLVAFYEAVLPGDKKYESYAGLLNGLDSMPKIIPGKQYDWLLAGMTAFYKTAYALVFSKEQFQDAYDAVQSQLNKKKVSTDVHKRSVQFGEQVAARILHWASQDGFGKTRTMARFTLGKQAGNWQQTGPDFMEAIEPNWNTIRTLTLSKPDEFLLPQPAPFKSEIFLAECDEVYKAGNNLTLAQRAFTNFWDCNPYATETVGHLMYSIKKISPAGHWIGITGIAVQQKKQGLVAAMYTYSLVAVAIFDAIIATWDEKYRSNYIRPVTAIQELISPTWEPFLQTPPFPEYPSGHSVISATAATILTHLFGNNFHYVDDVEKPYGLPSRSFNSFTEAANEAAVSRLYGGLHFREAIDNGKILGKNIAGKTLEKLMVK